MKNKFQILLFLVVVTIQYSFSQTRDTLYFDANWKKTTNENFSFYRPLPLKIIDSLVLIQDYYKNGNMQMQGYVYAMNEDKFAGDIYWYKEDGTDVSQSKFINTTNKPLTYYHHNGTVWKTLSYEKEVKVGTVKLYNNKGKEIRKEIYKDGFTINDTLDNFASHYYSTYKDQQIEFVENIKKISNPTKVLYWLNSGKLASVTDYKDSNTISQKIYAESGKLIKEYKQNNFIDNKLIDGEDYVFKTTNGFVVSMDSTLRVSQQHQVVKINNISLVKANKTGRNIAFYKKSSSDKYSELDFSLFHKIDSNGVSASFMSYENQDNYQYSYEDIYDKDDYVIAVSQIKRQTVSQLFESLKLVEWETIYKESDYYTNDTIHHRTTFKLFNNYIFSYVDEEFTTKRNGGFGSYYKEDDDDVKKWRIDNLDFYITRVFLLNGNRPILILSDENNIQYYIIPTKDNKFIVNLVDRDDNLSQEHRYTEFSNTALEKISQYSDSQNFYRISTKNEKRYIANAYDEIIINKAYDSIQLVNQYIIARNENAIDIYNSKLQKLPIINTRQVYFDRGNLQILTDNKLFYIDALGNETKREFIFYSFCGTVNSTSFTLVQTEDEKPVNAIRIFYGGMGRRYHEEHLMKINNLDTTYAVTFLNKTQSDGYDGNSGFVDGYKNLTNMLVVSKNKKFGLYNYNLEDVDFNYKADTTGITDIDTLKYGSTNANMLLAVNYDAIELRNPLIIVKLNDAYGIYPLKEGFKYKTLGDVNNNFISFEALDGQKGWIDVHTFQEFPVSNLENKN